MTLIDDVRRLHADLRDLAAKVLELDEAAEQNRLKLARHEEQMNGERGLSAAINQLTREVASLRRAAYWVAGLIVAGSIGFAFSVLQLVS